MAKASDKKRNTVQRSLVLNALKVLNTHATAEQIYEHVVKTHPSISKATIYRNLNQLVESGKLTNIGTFHGSALYDHMDHEHYHFVCKECKSVHDINEEFPEITTFLENRKGFDVHNVHLSFKGYCPDCNK
jgi:Fur family ferric uptake transcriptional regulator/Fur family peroxide stress response transcriptional regulator